MNLFIRPVPRHGHYISYRALISESFQDLHNLHACQTTELTRSHCWGRHLRPLTEGLRTGGVTAESVINHVFTGQAKSRSPLRSEWLRRHLRRPRAKALFEAMRREVKRHLRNGGGGSEGLVRSPAKSCEVVSPERLHRRWRRPSG